MSAFIVVSSFQSAVTSKEIYSLVKLASKSLLTVLGKNLFDVLSCNAKLDLNFVLQKLIKWKFQFQYRLTV